jgi:peptidyl-prolyl cis-trans isomerase A (cyclophilin A)
MDVVDKIAALPTRGLGPFATDVPNPLVVIDSANVIGEEAPGTEQKPATAKPGTEKTAPAPAKSADKPKSKG